MPPELVLHASAEVCALRGGQLSAVLGQWCTRKMIYTFDLSLWSRPSIFRACLRGKTWEDKQSPFRRFAMILSCLFLEKEHLGGADFHRKPQICTGNCRQLQERAENRRLAFVPLLRLWFVKLRAALHFVWNTPAHAGKTPTNIEAWEICF